MFRTVIDAAAPVVLAPPIYLSLSLCAYNIIHFGSNKIIKHIIKVKMGNDQSTVIDEERKMLESLYQISEGRLDTNDHDHINSKVNSGTSVPNCQPLHTLREIEEEREAEAERIEGAAAAAEILEAERLAGLVGMNDSQHRAYLEAQKRVVALERADSSSSSTGSFSGKPPQQLSQQQAEKGSIGSFVQMAKTGYQELVNAVIR